MDVLRGHVLFAAARVAVQEPADEVVSVRERPINGRENGDRRTTRPRRRRGTRTSRPMGQTAAERRRGSGGEELASGVAKVAWQHGQRCDSASHIILADLT